MRFVRLATILSALASLTVACAPRPGPEVAQSSSSSNADGPGATPKLWPCTQDSDCAVACDLPGNCCGQGCDCTMVYHVDELAALRADNRERCASMDVDCDQHRCNEAVQQALAVCESGTCVRKFEPLKTSWMQDGFFLDGGAPTPTYCETVEDCVGDTIPAEGGCCNDPTNWVAHAKAYRAWIGKWRAVHCGEVTCPPPPPPAKPADCHFEMTCLDNRCGDRCGDE